MRKIFIFYLVLLSFFSSKALATQNLQIVGGDTLHLGRLLCKQKSAESDMILRNLGNEKITIVNMRASCGCTKPELSKNEIAPGDSAILHVKITLADRDGAINKKITLYINDSTTKREISIQAVLYSYLRPIPTNSFLITNMELNKEMESKPLTIKNNSERDITIKEIKASSKTLRCDLPVNTVIKAKDTISAHVFATATEYGNIKGTIDIVTNVPDADLSLDFLGIARKETKIEKTN